MTVTINMVLKQACERLAGEAQPALEAEILLAHSLDASRSFLYANPDLALPDVRLSNFNKLLLSRLNGTPIAYLTNVKEFWSLPLEVSPATLIPRPDTELLVEYALELLPVGSEARVADLGTGCGAIALAIASERPTARITATDISGSALDIARGNASRLEIGNVDFVVSDWFAALDGEFDMVVSNPPYISSADGHLHRGDLRFEPELALASGPEGLDAIRSIISGCSGVLSAKGHILLEHGFEQATAVRALLAESGFTGVQTLQDIESRDRLTTAQSGD